MTHVIGHGCIHAYIQVYILLIYYVIKDGQIQKTVSKYIDISIVSFSYSLLCASSPSDLQRSSYVE